MLAWFDALKLHVLHELGTLSMLFDLSECGLTVEDTAGAAFADLRVDVSPIDGVRAAMVSFMEREKAKIALQAVYCKIEELAEKHLRIFGLVMGQLRAESKAALRATPGFAELDKDRKDTKKHLLLAVEMHLTRGSRNKLVN
ncbi:hypothetical protein FVE85_9525 [Porphyridium purpureum]|uniref:Uncharacterized protein n=1 Tax=Porphyridium purpureum TaxID=35688 RepID=A0A5J4YK35_PORPP|nr:hypothetical protein FVE85_9525 [Porphyridium purpureum]|eukprot:POR1473..scf261_15